MASFRWLCLVSLFLVGFSGYLAQADEVPTYSQCKVHIEAAIKDKAIEPPLADDADEVVADVSNDAAEEPEDENEPPADEQPVEEAENGVEEAAEEEEEEAGQAEEAEPEQAAEEEDDDDDDEADDEESPDEEPTADQAAPTDDQEETEGPEEDGDDDDDDEPEAAEAEEPEETEQEAEEETDDDNEEAGEASAEKADNAEQDADGGDAEDDDEAADEGDDDDEAADEAGDNDEAADEADDDDEAADEADDDDEAADEADDDDDAVDDDNGEVTEDDKADDVVESQEGAAEEEEEEEEEAGSEAEADEQAADADGGDSEPAEPAEAAEEAESAEAGAASEPEGDDAEEDTADGAESEPEHDEAEPSAAEDSLAAEPEAAEGASAEEAPEEESAEPEAEAAEEEATSVQAEAAPVEEQASAEEAPFEGVIEEEPEVRRSRDHIAEILKLDEEPENSALKKNAIQVTLREVKKVVESAVRPLEDIFKYKDVSNRHFGDNEVFSKPLILFLGPWSGGKSSIINYLLGIEFTKNALKSGAEPSATYFQIMMHGDEEEHMDGTQLAADWTFSGLQKFGQAFIDRLRGKRLPSKLLQKANVVEIPGILEMRREVDRPYPFNDVVQWFVDRADLIFVVYDPTKLDMGLEHEALFDQLKGRQNQVRVLLNKADTVSQEELLLIQNNLMWQLSPLLASPLPPVVYAGSFWSKPYNPESPRRLLAAHEENMLNDIREALDNVVENTIAEARRHAVRVRNHAKMVDCYLTTFFNHKGYFGNKEKVMEDIIENPHQYHIFEGLSTLTNISRYDLPDADVYRDFFKVHKLYQFQNLASTCSFFRGCPIDKLDVAISYELPELIGKYKKRLQSINGKPKVEKKSS